jgi:hypothetical protein
MVRVARGEGSKAEELDYEGDREVLLLEEVFCKKNARLANHMA